MNLIICNCKGANGLDYRRHFRSLLDWHKPPLVALLETKMHNHQSLLEDFPFTRMIEVPLIGNSGGIVVLLDDIILDLDKITTTSQEVHAIIKVNSMNFFSYIVFFMLVLIETCIRYYEITFVI